MYNARNFRYDWKAINFIFDKAASTQENSDAMRCGIMNYLVYIVCFVERLK